MTPTRIDTAAMDTRNFTLRLPDISLCSTTSVLVTEIWEERRGKCKITCSITSHDLHCYCKGWLNNLSALIYSYNNHNIIAQLKGKNFRKKAMSVLFFWIIRSTCKTWTHYRLKTLVIIRNVLIEKIESRGQNCSPYHVFQGNFYGWVDFLLFPLVHCYWHIQQCCCYGVFFWRETDSAVDCVVKDSSSNQVLSVDVQDRPFDCR